MFDQKPQPLSDFFPIDRDGNTVRVFIVIHMETLTCERFVGRTKTHATGFFGTPSPKIIERYRRSPASFFGVETYGR